ncbi:MULTISPECIES: cell division protein ZapA [Deefgea]|uniref:Cell division protein ZapA n=2 Tax=Deefgea TaxID=400947 RepID=A0A6M8SSH1_9NEIS|nr:MULTISPECIES: cell division protein ZapA [Deefgea]MCB5196434.1 cell division protein ZapA [Deefgea salmonis]QKJ66276.1 cell division protein ZapA [Deefgea piscis]QZA81415.1 cell division protein ZapA [Deefgea piscis]
MTDAVKLLDISIMGREFRVACPAHEEETLLQAVQLLDARMHEIRTAGKVIGIEKIAMMTALNMTHEFLTAKVEGGFDFSDFQRKIGNISSTIDAVLQE